MTARCGHEPDAIYKNGDCRDCDRAYQMKYRRRRKLGMALLRAAEARGLSGGEALALLQHADYWTLQKCQSEGVALVAQVPPRCHHPREYV